MSSRPVGIEEIKIPLNRIKSLSDEHRYSYYLLGHMFNELMFMQKLVGFAFPKHDDVRPQRLRPELAQTMFLFRIACSKIWEAKLKINSKEVSATLRNVVLPKMDGGQQRLKDLNAKLKDASWLSGMRNEIGFHYPNFEDWKAHITPNDQWTDDYVFLSGLSGNTFYDASDSAAQGLMFGQYGLANPREAVKPLVDEMIELLRVVNSFLEDALGEFIGSFILEGKGKRRAVGKVLSPAHVEVFIPFWTSMRPQDKDLIEGGVIP